MKKLLLAFASAFCILFIASCAETPEDQCISMLNDASEEVSKAKTQAEVIKIGVQTYKNLEKFVDELPDEEKEKLFENEKVKAASEKYAETTKEVMNKLKGNGKAATDKVKETSDKAKKAADKVSSEVEKATKEINDKVEQTKEELKNK